MLEFTPTDGKPYSKINRCRERLKWLFQYGYLERKAQTRRLDEPAKPLLYFLDEKGALLIAEKEGLFREQVNWRSQDNQLSDLFLNHTLAINDLRINFAVSANKLDMTIPEWKDERVLKNLQNRVVVEIKTGGTKQKFNLYPDAYNCIEDNEGSQYHHFIEVDLGTETIKSSGLKKKDFQRKILAYRAYIQSGKFEKTYGADIFRVLIIAGSRNRMLNLKSASEEIEKKGNEIFWFTTLNQLQNANIISDPIWFAIGNSKLEPLIEQS